jgi:biotin operon repressor
MEANDVNKKYDKLKAAGWFIEQRRLGYLVENRIAGLLKAQGIEIDPKKIPEFVDSKIRERIENII